MIKKDGDSISLPRQSQKSSQGTIWKSLDDDMRNSSGLNKEKIDETLSQILNGNSNVYHTVQIKLEYGGEVILTTYKDDFVLTIDLKGEEGGIYERRFRDEEKDRL